jgi:pilus assembly protein CpaE
MSGSEVRCLVVGGDGDAELTRAADRAPGVMVVGSIDATRVIAGLRPACDALLLAGADRGVLRDLVAASDVPVVVAVPRLDMAAMRMAMTAGARGVVERPFDPSTLAGALRDAAGATAVRTERPPAGRVVVVCGAKGGVGASAVAVALAAARGALVVDAAAAPVGLARHLGCSAERTLADLLRLGSGVSTQALRSVAVEHPTGMRLLAAPDEAAALSLPPPGTTAALVRACRAEAALTVADLGRPGDPATLELARCADEVLVVATPDALACASAAVLVERLVRAGVRHESVLLVVNRWSKRCELSVRAVERAVGLPLAAVLRDDHHWGEAFAGGALPRTGGRRGTARDLARLLDRLVA